MFLAVLVLTGCASAGSHEGQRTVFNNPLAVPVIDRTGVGPQCERARGQDATCLGVPLTRKGRGNSIAMPESIGLTRNQRRILRERAELLRTVRQQPQVVTPPPPPPPPRIAEATGEADAETP
ncbi:MAG: hypothetical protein EAY70_11385 [Sphingomonadales bacterium]|nr:MAG: hypothetical protein EAY70_11385 [Sphingomonadales bacterium]